MRKAEGYNYLRVFLRSAWCLFCLLLSQYQPSSDNLGKYDIALDLPILILLATA